MFENFYKIKISGKDVRRFIKTLYRRKVYFEEISFNNDSCYVKVDHDNYKKIIDIKTSYNIEIVNLYGMNKVILLIKTNFLFLICNVLGLFLIYFLSHIIFNIEIIHDDASIRELLYGELEKYDIKRFRFVKNYDYIADVKNKILNDNKDVLEWIELERHGTKYEVRVDKRVINDIKEEDKIKHIVAKKPGIIMKIVAEKGEVIKKITDYVKEGDTIISGEIFRNGEVIGTTSASGKVYAEVWYSVKVEMPISYKEEKKTGNSKHVINISFLNETGNLFDFNPYDNKEITEKILFSDFFGLFKISFNKESEVIIKDEVNNIISEEFALKLARAKIEENLKDDEYIISQKKLKTVINNSTIITEVFFKVYEDISCPKYFNVEEGNSG